MGEDIRLKKIVAIPSGEVAVKEERHKEIIFEALEQVFADNTNIVRRIPFHEDYREYPEDE